VIRNTYVNKQVVKNTGSRASFNGPGGATAKATAQEQTAAKAEHIPATSAQQSRVEAAKNNPDLHAANNHGKPKAEAIRALDRNTEAQANTGKAKGKAGQEAGNSAFGHKQGDATTRTTGSQNNAFGKAQSADAHASNAAKSREETGEPHAQKAKQTKHDSHANNVATAHHASKHAQVASHRPKGAPTQHAGPASSTYAKKGQAAHPNKKKKPAKEEPGGGH
jgi:hypothetical protein